MAWNPNPRTTSAIIIDKGATVVVPKQYKFNNYGEIIIINGVLKFESDESYNNSGSISISSLGKVIIPTFNESMYRDCESGAKVTVNDATYTYDGESWNI